MQGTAKAESHSSKKLTDGISAELLSSFAKEQEFKCAALDDYFKACISVSNWANRECFTIYESHASCLV